MTFSIAAHDPERDAYGVGVTTGTVAVGATCPHVSARAAVSTQSFTSVDIGREAVERAAEGTPVDEACGALLDADPHADYRQVHGVGEETTFIFTGEACVGWHGSVTGEHHTVAGNMLSGEAVVTAASEAFEEREGDLSERLVSALEAGRDAGGDERGEISAALLVHDPEPTMYHNLRVDSADDPVGELRALLTEARDAQARVREDVERTMDDYPEEILSFGLKY